jgi:TetR/AcrR family transcriptional regulator, cholesterol catabolism regulator
VAGALRKDLDVELVYRFIRDTVWVAVRWYHPGGPLTHEVVADQYLTILLDGIST